MLHHQHNRFISDNGVICFRRGCAAVLNTQQMHPLQPAKVIGHRAVAFDRRRSRNRHFPVAMHVKGRALKLSAHSMGLMGVRNKQLRAAIISWCIKVESPAVGSHETAATVRRLRDVALTVRHIRERSCFMSDACWLQTTQPAMKVSIFNKMCKNIRLCFYLFIYSFV